MKRSLLILGLLTGFSSLLAQRRVQHALHFDGVNDIVRAQTRSSTNLKDSAITVEAWIKPNGFEVLADGGTIIARHDAPGQRGFTLACGDEGRLYFGVFGDSTKAELTTAKNTVKQDSWTYVAATFDRTLLKVYVNGLLVDSLFDSTQIADVPFIPLTLGNHHDLSRPFWGSMDEAKLWSRCLTAAEILDQYQFWYCGYSRDLRAYFKFNRGTANGNNAIFFRIPDWSGYGNEGTLHNFALTGTSSNFVEGLTLNQHVMYRSDTVTACDQYRAPSRLATWTQSGTYADTVISFHGCDSALQIVLTIDYATYDTLTIRSCGPYTTPSGKQILTKSGIYTDFLKNSKGCDSILTIFAKIGADTTQVSATVCHSFTLPFLQKTYTQSGLYIDSLKGKDACDSLVYYQITVLPRTSFSQNVTICDSVFLPSSNRWVYQSGTHIDTLKNFRGCDSLVVYQLISLKTFAQFQDYACGNYVSPSKRFTWTQSGIWKDTLQNVKGCDSIITINLQVNPVTDTVLQIHACRSYRAPSRRFFITQSGTYHDTVMNAYGCDSVITIIATIPTFNRVITSSNDTLFAQTGYTNYQWLRCDSNFQWISGETLPYLIPKSSGHYAVRFQNETCVDTSQCFNYNPNAVVKKEWNVRVFPNPSEGTFWVSCQNESLISFECYSLQGQKVAIQTRELSESKHYEISLSHSGCYLLVLRSANGGVHFEKIQVR